MTDVVDEDPQKSRNGREIATDRARKQNLQSGPSILVITVAACKKSATRSSRLRGFERTCSGMSILASDAV